MTLLTLLKNYKRNCWKMVETKFSIEKLIMIGMRAIKKAFHQGELNKEKEIESRFEEVCDKFPSDGTPLMLAARIKLLLNRFKEANESNS